MINFAHSNDVEDNFKITNDRFKDYIKTDKYEEYKSSIDEVVNICVANIQNFNIDNIRSK